MCATLLLLETATEVCSVALSMNDEIISSAYLEKGNSHTENLFPFIMKTFQESNKPISALDGVVLSMGPGSYTGLRIGASAAKGICYALSIPLIGISTLQSLAFGAMQKQKKEQNILFCPMIDAGRMEVFTAMFDATGKMVSEVGSLIIDKNSFTTELNSNIVYFCGNGMNKCQSVLQHPNARFIEVSLSAENMLLPALERYESRQYEDVAYFEPFYLKEYIAKKSTIKGICLDNARRWKTPPNDNVTTLGESGK